MLGRPRRKTRPPAWTGKSRRTLQPQTVRCVHSRRRMRTRIHQAHILIVHPLTLLWLKRLPPSPPSPIRARGLGTAPIECLRHSLGPKRSSLLTLPAIPPAAGSPEYEQRPKQPASCLRANEPVTAICAIMAFSVRIF